MVSGVSESGAGQWGPPCRSACPVDKDIPGFLRAIAEGRSREAWEIAYRDNILPGVLGRICPRPCEAACRLGRDGTPIRVCDLKRRIIEMLGPPVSDEMPAAGTGPAVAVIGAGPAGLAAAHDLALLGARVTLLDRHEHPGGLLTAAIPGFRLPRDVVDADVGRILAAGVRFRGGFRLHEAAQLRELSGEGFAAVLLATGPGDDRTPDVAGWRSTPSSRTAIAFLQEFLRGRARLDGMRVCVVGGGNGAVDSARAAKRAGAVEVTILYRRGRGDLPAFPGEIEEALREGIAVHPWIVPKELVWSGDTLRALRCVSTRAVGSGSGRTRFEEVPGTERLVDCDAVVFAIGQERPRLPGPEAAGGLVLVSTAVESTGSVVEAIAAGRRAAARLRIALEEAGRWPGGANRAPLLQLRIAPELDDTREGDAAAAAEARRCLGCDRRLVLDPTRCILCGSCAEQCAPGALAWEPVAEGRWRLVHRDDRCDLCGDCIACCPSGALRWSSWTLPNRLHGIGVLGPCSRAAESSFASAGPD